MDKILNSKKIIFVHQFKTKSVFFCAHYPFVFVWVGRILYNGYCVVEKLVLNVLFKISDVQKIF